MTQSLVVGPFTYFTGQDENGVWQSITEEESQAKFGKGAGELLEVYKAAYARYKEAAE